MTGIGLFTVEVQIGDGVYMSVPNSALWNKPIKNFSHLVERQLSVAVGIPYGGDLTKALSILRGLLDDPRVLRTPAAKSAPKRASSGAARSESGSAMPAAPSSCHQAAVVVTVWSAGRLSRAKSSATVGANSVLIAVCGSAARKAMLNARA